MSATIIKTLDPIVGSLSGVNAIYNANNLLYFFIGGKLYRSDGSENGTFDVLESPRTNFNSGAINSTFLFVNSDNQNGAELWVSNGTTTGTRILKDINPVGSSRPEDFLPTDNLLFFTAFEENNGRALYVSDGTEAGTKLIKDIDPNPGRNSPGFDPFRAFSDNDINGTIFFVGLNETENGSLETGLWKSDGTEAGTQFIRAFETAPDNSAPTNLTVGDTLLYFTYRGQLWKSDGTELGTVLVAGNLGFISSSGLSTVGDTVFFSKLDNSIGLELWKSDGTEVGTVLVKDIREEERQNGVPINRGSDPKDFLNVNGTLFFTADDGVHGRELWKSDGTTNGTSLVKDITEGINSTGFNTVESFPEPNKDSGSFLEIDGELYFTIGGSSSPSRVASLYKSDGTANGTVPIITDAGSPNNSLIDQNTEIIKFQDNTLFSGRTFIPEGGSGELFNALYKLDSDDTSTEPLVLTGGTVQIAYVAYYGRPGDPGGLGFWNGVFTNSNVSYSPRNGDGLTGSEAGAYNLIVDAFGNSSEANNLLAGLSLEQKVNQVFQFCFNRDADPGGLAFWSNAVNNGLSLAQFALEIALGAQNEDIILLRNKISSANLMSDVIDTPQENQAISTPAYANFGRNWLKPFGDTSASLFVAETALAGFVANPNGVF